MAFNKGLARIRTIRYELHLGLISTLNNPIRHVLIFNDLTSKFILVSAQINSQLKRQLNEPT